MKRNFENWLETFRPSIANFAYYVDFPKVYKRVDELKIPLNILNSLIGAPDIENSFRRLLANYPETAQCIPILLAVRSQEIHATELDGDFIFSFLGYGCPISPDGIEQYVVFMRKSGLFELLQNHLVRSLIDYVTGVEVGLDSNGRKNRGGHLMENLVESHLLKAGLREEVDYFKEMYIHEVEQMWNIDLSSISNNGTTKKRFDFVVVRDNMISLIETNFYTSGGSKLNETARSYKLIAEEISALSGVRFIWITDGIGWRSAAGNLRETFDELETLYNIRDLENGVLQELFPPAWWR